MLVRFDGGRSLFDQFHMAAELGELLGVRVDVVLRLVTERLVAIMVRRLARCPRPLGRCTRTSTGWI